MPPAGGYHVSGWVPLPSATVSTSAVSDGTPLGATTWSDLVVHFCSDLFHHRLPFCSGVEYITPPPSSLGVLPGISGNIPDATVPGSSCILPVHDSAFAMNAGGITDGA